MKRRFPATWSPKQQCLAFLLATGKGIKAASSEVGIGERTAHTWLDHPGFRHLISELRSRILDEAVGRLVESSTKAVDTLVGLLDSDVASIQLRAALGILESTIRLREHADFERRISALEVVHENRTEDQDDAA
jgi:hypothetical protein